MEDEDLINEIMKWIEIEINAASFFGGLAGSMTDDHLKAMFQKFYIDSLKHQRILEAIIRLLRAEKHDISLDQHPKIIDQLKGYIKIEEFAMENAEAMMAAIDDEIVKLMLKQIFDDEIEHHKMLELIIVLI